MAQLAPAATRSPAKIGRRARERRRALSIARAHPAIAVRDRRSLQEPALDLAPIGRREQPREDFSGLLGCRNSFGLLSEDIHPQTGALWGNFPQTYSMAGIINVATRLSEKWEDVWCRVSS
jgi:hypothetical protein